jgi:hypothetical protein
MNILLESRIDVGEFPQILEGNCGILEIVSMA